MHFWIDKRSQTCGFGRARVAASLSGSGFDFGHPPRRIGGKLLVAPIHRFQPVDCRPFYRSDRSDRTDETSTASAHRVSNSSGSSSAASSTRQSNGRHSTRSHNHNVPQRAQTARPRHIHRNPHETTNQINVHYRQPADYTAVVQQFNQSHALELEQGPLGINALGTSHVVEDGPNVVAVATNDSQLFPSHLKCGMWASLALATVFLAGTGLEVLIFCTFSATFLLAACTVSLCRRPGNVNISTPQIISQSPNPNAMEHIQQIDQMDQIDAQLSNPLEVIDIDVMSAPPPPYHIAIMAIKDIDESPPPSYDKLLL